jgi:hypothetical protein
VPLRLDLPADLVAAIDRTLRAARDRRR